MTDTIDVSALATRVFDAVKPAIDAYGTGALVRDEQKGSPAAAERGREILQEIYWRDKNVPPLESAVTDFAAGPRDEDAAAGLRLEIKKVLASDGALASDIAKMLQGGSSHADTDAKS
jgi:hypothetical protein